MRASWPRLLCSSTEFLGFSKQKSILRQPEVSPCKEPVCPLMLPSLTSHYLPSFRHIVLSKRVRSERHQREQVGGKKRAIKPLPPHCCPLAQFSAVGGWDENMEGEKRGRGSKVGQPFSHPWHKYCTSGRLATSPFPIHITNSYFKMGTSCHI